MVVATWAVAEEAVDWEVAAVEAVATVKVAAALAGSVG